MLAGQTLQNVRAGIKAKPLDILRAKKIFLFNCHPQYLDSIPKAMSLMNVMWATKQLDKASGKVKKKDQIKRKKEK